LISLRNGLTLREAVAFFFPVWFFHVEARMPALFAYLIAVGFLLGGGYGALSWLAAPEPVKVVAKAKPELPRRAEAKLETSSPETSSLSEKISSGPGAPEITDSGRAMASGSSELTSSELPSPQSISSAAATEQGASAETSSSPQSRSAHAEITSAEANQPAPVVSAPVVSAQVLPAQVLSPASSGNQQASASAAPAAKTSKRPHVRQATGGRSEKSALAPMTLRTIEFPDGRRVTQLVPYRSGERALAFEREEFGLGVLFGFERDE
jgi:hypothetical protein